MLKGSSWPLVVVQGIHKIEALLFRDLNISGAVDYAARYVNSSQQLREALQNRFELCDSLTGVGSALQIDISVMDSNSQPLTIKLQCCKQEAFS